MCLHADSSTQPVVVSSLQISRSLNWTIYVHSVRLEASTVPALSNLPSTICCVSDVLNILSAINNSTICQGNEYDTYATVVEARNGTLRDSQGTQYMSTLPLRDISVLL